MHQYQDSNIRTCASFVQLVLWCVLVQLVAAIPKGFITFFDSQSCPSGWVPHASSAGRLIVSTKNPSESGLTLHSKIADREDRNHTHSASSSWSFGSQGVAGLDGCCCDAGAGRSQSVSIGPTSTSTSGYPMVQLLTCMYNGSQLLGEPVAKGTLGFFDSSCPVNWAASDALHGRVVLAGSVEAYMQNDVASLSSNEDRKHSHTFSVTIAGGALPLQGWVGATTTLPAHRTFRSGQAPTTARPSCLEFNF